jgi:phytoene dehydrogenase-like protein
VEREIKMETHDVVVIGGGHNGLTVAAYLAKAKLKVCVLEKQDKVGGGVITRELTLPGFKHDPGSIMHGIISANPLIHRDELGLQSKYGLKYVYPDKIFAAVFPDDRALVFQRDLDKTCESISRFSARDADAYRAFCKAITEMRKVVSIGMFSPPPSWGAMMSVLNRSHQGRELLRILLSSVLDVAEDWFESEEMKLAMCRYASELMIGPREKGTGSAMWFVAGLHRWPIAMPIGGSGALSEALQACIKDHGGSIKVSDAVKSIRVEGDVAKGVILESGEEVLATKAVISNVHVKQLFLDMVKPEKLPAGFLEIVKRIRPATFSGLHQAIALNEAPKYKAGVDVDTALFVEFTPFLEEFLRSFDDYFYGIPRTNMPLVVTATIFDPSRAPEGKHTLYLWHYEPYKLKDGGPSKWDNIKQEIADSILETVCKHTTNLTAESSLGRWMMSPFDLPKYFPSMLDGDIGHIGHFLTQSFDHRPFAGWGPYKTPIVKLYMTGASTHPGTGVTGGGRATAQVIMEDLGIDFKKVIAK